ncbi:MAG: response regulator [Candidatus Levyibacteriota bacterium]
MSEPGKQEIGGRLPQKDIDLSGLRILVVEDSPILTLVYRRALADLGLSGNTSFAETSPQAEKIFDALRAQGVEPNVVLLDYHIPGGDGLQVLHTLRAKSPELAATMITSMSEEDLRQKESTEEYGYINKDRFTVDSLKSNLEKFATKLNSKQAS